MIMRNKIVTVLIIIVIFIFGILFFTMTYDSNENLVGEIENMLEFGGVL